MSPSYCIKDFFNIFVLVIAPLVLFNHCGQSYCKQPFITLIDSPKLRKACVFVLYTVTAISFINNCFKDFFSIFLSNFMLMQHPSYFFIKLVVILYVRQPNFTQQHSSKCQHCIALVQLIVI